MIVYTNQSDLTPCLILFWGVDLMSRQQTASKIEPHAGNDESIFWSDDECVQKLAALIEHRDTRNLGEIARLIGRLAVPVE
jgi:hypothetical protein